MIIFFLLNEDFNLSVRCEFKAYENLDEMQKVVAIFYNVLITRIKEWVIGRTCTTQRFEKTGLWVCLIFNSYIEHLLRTCKGINVSPWCSPKCSLAHPKNAKRERKKHTSWIGIAALGILEEEKYKINEFSKCQIWLMRSPGVSCPLVIYILISIDLCRLLQHKI